MEGGGDRVRLSEQLERGAIEAGLVDPSHERHAIFWLSAKIGAPSDLDLEHELNSVQPGLKTPSQLTFSLHQFLASRR